MGVGPAQRSHTPPARHGSSVACPNLPPGLPADSDRHYGSDYEEEGAGLGRAAGVKAPRPESASAAPSALPSDDEALSPGGHGRGDGWVGPHVSCWLGEAVKSWGGAGLSGRQSSLQQQRLALLPPSAPQHVRRLALLPMQTRPLTMTSPATTSETRRTSRPCTSRARWPPGRRPRNLARMGPGRSLNRRAAMHLVDLVLECSLSAGAMIKGTEHAGIGLGTLAST